MRRGPQAQLALLVAGCVCLGAGCALPTLSPGVDPVSRKSHAKRAIASASEDVGREANEALSLLEQQEFGQALEKIRRQLQQPRFNSAEYLAALREAAIEILGEYQSFHGFSPQLDAEAKGYYEEALIYSADDDERRAELISIYANYFSNTDRNGLALQAFDYELQLAENAGDDYRAIKALDALANVYHDMGDLPQRDQLRSEALRRAEEFFVVGVRPDGLQRWAHYETFLFNRIVDIAPRGEVDAILATWGEIEQISNTYEIHAERSYLPFLRIAEYLAVAGDLESARSFFEMGERRVDRSPDTRAELDLICRRSTIHALARAYRAAAEGYESCLRTQRALGKATNPGMAQFAGRAFEGIGRYERAVELYQESIGVLERTRSSFNASDRAAFFRNQVRQAYWGLIRTAARQSELTGEAPHFLRAVQMAELVRARQLGDQIEERRARNHAADLSTLTAALGPEEVVLGYTLTGTDIIILAFSDEGWIARVLEYDARAFRDEVMSLARHLADPRSAPRSIDALAQSIGEKVLDPVASLVADKPLVTVMPDGVLNLIPFELLTASGGEPLWSDHVVRASPSVRFLRAARSSPEHMTPDDLFAIADATSETPAGEAIAAVTRPSLLRGVGYSSKFEALPETRTEVSAVASMFDEPQTRILIGTSATESAVKAESLDAFRFLHFATHGILGNEVPGLTEPALVLASEASEDGFLTSSEAAELSLGSELAVLSACRTGVGDYVTGEGVMGMSRAFLIAGSRAVLVSLWQVDSAATEELVVSFYRRLMSGSTAAVALREAKQLFLDRSHTTATTAVEEANPRNPEAARERGIAKLPREPGSPGSRRTSYPQEGHPFYWAGFVLIGG